MEEIREGSEEMEMKKRYTNKQIYREARKSVLINEGLHQRLKLQAVAEKTSIKALIEESLEDLLAIRNNQ